MLVLQKLADQVALGLLVLGPFAVVPRAEPAVSVQDPGEAELLLVVFLMGLDVMFAWLQCLQFYAHRVVQFARR